MELPAFSPKHLLSSADTIAGLHPSFIDQAADYTRQGLIKSAIETEYGLGSDTSISGNVPKTRLYTETAALLQTKDLLEEAITNPSMPVDIVERAEDIYENLNFVGEKELTEATRAIAEQWKIYLNDNSDLSLFIVTNKSFDAHNLEFEDSEVLHDHDIGYVSNNKSDVYILDNVLSNFTDQEAQKYRNRLLFSASGLSDCASHNVKTIILDDWIMSGQQMQDTLDRIFTQTTPSDLEINLVISSKDRLVNGFMINHQVDPVPIKAYFAARSANHSYASEFGGVYLTAAHSTGDYPFEGSIEEIVGSVNDKISREEKRFFMPPLTNIVRPYYSPDYRPRYIERLKVLRAIGGRATH